jgi:acyl-coenzyme A thioesterase PaaI-like protein
MPFLVEALEPGYAVIALEDRPRIRNHLKSIHAIALANVSELTGSLALTSSMPADARFIVKTLSIDYVKKARGRVVATCRCPVPKSNERAFYPVEVEVRNEKQEIVCRTELAILIGPKDSSL